MTAALDAAAAQMEITAGEALEFARAIAASDRGPEVKDSLTSAVLRRAGWTPPAAPAPDPTAGKTFDDLTPAERNDLARRDPARFGELVAAMRETVGFPQTPCIGQKR